MYGYLGKWTFFIKSIGMIFATSAGLIVGKEGPFVHISCCCGNLFSSKINNFFIFSKDELINLELFPKYGNNEARKREILSAAAATGVSVAFGAPIGGILFSLEEISYYFPYKTLWRTFFCCMIGALVVRTINPYGNGHEIQFPVEYNVQWATFEVIPFIGLGALGGLWAKLFIKTNIRWLKYKKTTRIGQYPRAEVIVLTLITAIVCYPNNYLRLTMPELIRRLVGQCHVDDHMDLW
jgi:chloride channel 3/4/5